MKKILTVFIISILTILINSYCYGMTESNVLIFVSFSMPKESLKGWINDADRIHAPVIIRGLVNNSFKETTRKMSDLVKDNKGGIQLDPTLFKTFDIKQVPAVVVTKSLNCPPNQTCIPDFDVIYGDVHLDYALRKIADQNDNLSSIAQAALNDLRGNHHA